MPADIVIQGERYKDAEELRSTIAELELAMDDMPSDSPQHGDMVVHIQRLREALAEASPGMEGEESPVSVPAGQTVPGEDNEDEELEEIEPLADNDTEDSLTHCPACGWPLDIDVMPPHHPDIETCSGCQGFGKVLTGSRVEGHILMDCPTCKGQGWTNKAQTNQKLTTATRAEMALWPNARSSDDGTRWLPPEDSTPPWSGAAWDEFRGTWA